MNSKVITYKKTSGGKRFIKNIFNNIIIISFVLMAVSASIILSSFFKIVVMCL
ncbi:hypothetical protein [Clostridioides difficile]|uniref:hypothetical protein n=1 Tax=Clostridioides difficile TaxID=1496 RepID=UPI0013EFBB04|nr:hypothetical protein [Clostridioides difficile]MDM9944021.1 hypothetical protein [Clostridioides difficile]